MSKKKVNPRRIPLAKKYVDRKAILTEVVEGKLDDAWILASNALYDEGYKDLDGICDAVSAFLNSDAYTKANSEELKQATAISGIQEPVVHTRLENIKSQYELDAYKKKGSMQNLVGFWTT